MIHGISGKSGGGKSYEAVTSHIIPIITKQKRKVVTNIPLDVDAICLVYGEFCRDLIEVVDGQFHNYGGERPFSKVEHFKQYDDWKNEQNLRVYFFVDEAHLPMPRTGCDKSLIEFMSMARHSGYDIMLISQDLRKIHKDIVFNVANHFKAIKKTMTGQDHLYILKVYEGPSAIPKNLVATHERKYLKRNFQFYNSHTDSSGSVTEASNNDIQKWYSHWSIKASVFFFIFAFFILSKAIFKDDKPSVDKAAPVALPSSPPVEHSFSESVEQTLPGNNNIIPSSKSQRVREFERLVENSASFHPFYKVDLSVSGSSDTSDPNFRVHRVYFSASQNGQHVFTIDNSDLSRAGYDVQVLGDCAVKITYFDYQDFLTCNAPTQSVTLGDDQQLASN